MASRYYGVNKGVEAYSVSEDSSTTSKKVELVVDLSANQTRQEVLVALKKIEDHIMRGIWPPA